MTGLELLGLVMLILLLGVIFIGFPIAFTLLFLAFSFGLIGLGPRVFDLAYFQIIGLMKEEVLAAVPLFIFMGYVTEQAGLMERLFLAFRDLLAPVRGALFLVVILAAMVLVGALLLRAAGIGDATSTSGLGVGIFAVVCLLVLVDELFSPWMLVVLPVVGALGFALSHWVTTHYGDSVKARD